MSPEMSGDRAPERECFGCRGIVHGVLKEPVLQIADRMPVDDDIHPEVRTPFHRGIEQCEIAFGSPFTPRNRMDRNADQVRPHLLYPREELPAPVALALDLVGIRDRESPEEDDIPIRIDKPVSPDRYQRKLSGQGTVEGLARVSFVPPAVNLLLPGLSCHCGIVFLGADIVSQA